MGMGHLLNQFVKNVLEKSSVGLQGGMCVGKDWPKVAPAWDFTICKCATILVLILRSHAWAEATPIRSLPDTLSVGDSYKNPLEAGLCGGSAFVGIVECVEPTAT